MLRKCATAVAVSLVCLSGQAFAQQAPAKVKPTAASAVQRVSAKAAQSNQFEASPWLLFVVFGVATTVVIVAANEDDEGPKSPS